MTDFRTVGDLAQQLISRRQNADLRAELDDLVSEVGSGRKSDLSQSLRGDFTLLSGIEADLARLDAYAGTISELEGRGEAIQRVLDIGRELATETTSRLFTAVPPANANTVSIVASEARGRFDDLTARLNASYAGAALFAGTATNGAAIEAGETIRAALEAAVAPLTDAADVEAAVRAWFAPGGDFDTVAYLGSTDALPAVEISQTRRIALDVSADDPAIRDVLAGLALAALTDRPPLQGQLDEQGTLMVSAGEQLQNAQTSLADLQGRLGTAEAEIERQGVQNAAEQTALQESRAELTDVDIFEASTELEAVQARLELLYAITARSAQLSLVRVLQ
ncbi:MAG: flagellin [Pseudomonadota bacterium]